MVGVCTYSGHSYCRQRFADRLKEICDPKDVLIVWNGENLWGFDDFKVITIENKKDESNVDLLARKQNYIRSEFLKRGSYTHLLLLESDNIPSKDVIEKLATHKKDIVTAMYLVKVAEGDVVPTPQAAIDWAKKNNKPQADTIFLMNQKIIPTLWGIFNSSLFDSPRVRMWTVEDWFNYKIEGHSLVPIYSGGVGCTLISRKVLAKLAFDTKLPTQKQQLTDFVFFSQAHKMGYEAFVDLDCLCQHLHIDWLETDSMKKWFNPQTLDKP